MFWDSSAVVALLVPEVQSAALAALIADDREVTIWWGTPLECHSALHRRHREQGLPATHLAAAIDRIRALVEHTDTVSPSDELRRRAARLLALHPLRATDALQLASALLWCEEQPQGESFVSLDDRLREAATREGFRVVP